MQNVDPRQLNIIKPQVIYILVMNDHLLVTYAYGHSAQDSFLISRKMIPLCQTLFGYSLTISMWISAALLASCEGKVSLSSRDMRMRIMMFHRAFGNS